MRVFCQKYAMWPPSPPTIRHERVVFSFAYCRIKKSIEIKGKFGSSAPSSKDAP